MDFMERLEAIPAVYRWLMIPVMLLVLGGLYWYFQYQPHMEEMAQLQTQITEKQTELAKHQKIAAQYDMFKAQVAVLEGELRTLLRLLPESKEIPDLLRQISDLGVRTGLQINLVRPQPEQRKEFYAEVPITVHVKGQYHDVGLFFDALARLPRVVSVDGLQIEASKQEIQCLATTYRFLDEAEMDEAARAKKPTTTPKKAAEEAADDLGTGKKKK
jgi:type IV pilus assembly protein PilO